jgi:hypothetical protein
MARRAGVSLPTLIRAVLRGSVAPDFIADGDRLLFTTERAAEVTEALKTR